MDFIEKSNMARINTDLRAEVARLKADVVEIRKTQITESDLSAKLIELQYFENRRLRAALYEILEYPEERACYEIAEKALEVEP
jgi:hypothetical protein